MSHSKAETDSLFEGLVERNRRRLLGIARSYARGDEYQDLFQDILLQIWKSLDRFEGRSSADTWLYRIALNTALTFRRRADTRSRHIPPPAEDANQRLHALPAGSTPDLDLVRRFIGTLGAVDRAVFVLYLDDLSYREMAEILGLSEGAVGVRLNRIKKKFVAEYCDR